MKKYKATTSSEIAGSVMRNFFVGLNRNEFITIVERKLAEAGIDTIHDDEWYPLQMTLDILKAISELPNVTQSLVALGVGHVQRAAFPPEATTIEATLLLLDTVYKFNLRNFAEDEGFEVMRTGDRHIQVIDRTPFSHETIYGFIWGITDRFRSTDCYPMVVRTFENEADPHSGGAVYDISW